MDTTKKKYVISIFGNSGAGKSTLANALVSALSSTVATRVRGDHYLKSRGTVPMEEFLTSSDLVDWEAVREDLVGPIGSEISTPVYDFVNFQRISRRGDKPFVVSRLNVIDALIPYPRSDFVILVELDDGCRRRRFLERDGYVWRNFVLDHWNKCQKDFSKTIPDLTINGAAPTTESVSAVIAFLKDRGLT